MILKAVHYVNQFYAGIGGEEKADVGPALLEKVKGPAIAMNDYFGGELEIDTVIYCGDNFANVEENFEVLFNLVKNAIDRVKPDVFIAGPAFNAGRYGVACARVCDYVNNVLGVPSVCALWHENPAVKLFKKNNYLIASSQKASGMRSTIPKLCDFALKLAKREEILSARKEGYIPTGHRYNRYNNDTGAKRVVDILLDKLNDREYITEVPRRGFDMVKPADAITELRNIKVALITTGGLVPIGNPDGIKQAFATSFGKYKLGEVHELDSSRFESIHGGYDTTFASADPNRLIPYDELFELKKDGVIREIYDYFYTTCGVGTNVEMSKKMGEEIAKDLIKNKVDAAILTST